jgi:hypothetical protein
MRNACWITKATNTHSEYVTLIVFLWEDGFTNVPQCYVYTSPVLLYNLTYKYEGFAIYGEEPIKFWAYNRRPGLRKSIIFPKIICVWITTSILAGSTWRASETRRLE